MILACALVALALWQVEIFRQFVGSFVGTALSLLVGWFIASIERDDNLDAVPQKLKAALGDELVDVGCFRTAQTLHVSVDFDESIQKDVITLVFRSLINPIGQTSVKHQKVTAAKGTDLLESIFLVGHAKIEDGHSCRVHQKTYDELRVRYALKGDTIEGVWADHYWPSPIVDYVVIFDTSSAYEFTVARVLPGADLDVLQGIKKGKKIEFSSPHSAFTGQRLRWRVVGKESLLLLPKAAPYVSDA